VIAAFCILGAAMATDSELLLAQAIESLDHLQQAFEAMSTRLDQLTESVQQLTELLVDFDEDPDPATFSLDGPVENRTRDPNEPL
jgi:division protein CdvB (Snf7/Vps24/ESCRT-III family)